MHERLLRLSWLTLFFVVVFAPLALAFGRSHGLCKRLLVTSVMPSSAVAAARRRSPRLRGLAASSAEGDSELPASEPASARASEPASRGSPNPRPKRSRSKTPPKKTKPRAKKATTTKTTTKTDRSKTPPKKTKPRAKKATTTTKTTTKTAAAKKPAAKKTQKPNGGAPLEEGPTCLPRTAEQELLTTADESNSVRFVLGIDEAGRGPLAGPVVAAAAIVPVDLDGITDSKKLTREDQREALYEQIVNSENVRWAVAVMDAPFVDRVNILQATLRGMAAAASALVMVGGETIALGNDNNNNNNNEIERIPIVSDATIERKGCYVVRSPGHHDDKTAEATTTATTTAALGSAEDYYALIDGNKVPPDMPCPSHSIVKGDGKEYSIAAASILAKVTRDRLMRGYHELWPHYGLDKHKGYPTAAHMLAVREHGASPIHRRTFRPLKDMSFDENGRILEG